MKQENYIRLESLIKVKTLRKSEIEKQLSGDLKDTINILTRGIIAIIEIECNILQQILDSEKNGTR